MSLKRMAIGFCLLTMTFAASVTTLPASAQAQAATYSFDIPAQSLASALEAFGRTCNQQLVFDKVILRDKRSNALVGRYSAEEGITRLLEGSGLTFKRTAKGVLAIQAIETQDVSESTHSVRSEDSGQLSEIIVTAQKREERLMDVPMSIVAVTAEELKKRQITSIDDLNLVVPGLSSQSSGFARVIFIRGISSSAGSGPEVGIYFDDIAVSSVKGIEDPNLQTYDLERVEVLRGPQGTLYGQGAMGGTIRFITKDPQLDQFGMEADVAALFTPNGEPGQRVQSVVNVPLVENTAGLRITGTFDHEGGWINQPAIDKKDFNDQNLVDVRVKGLWKVTPEFTANIMAVIHRDHAPPSVGEDAQGNYTQVLGLSTTPDMQDDFSIYGATLTYDTSFMRVLSSTSYLDLDKDTSHYGFPVVATPVSFYVADRSQYDHVFNEEFRLTSLTSQALQWTVGTFYRNGVYELIENPYYYGTTPSPAFTYQEEGKSKSISVFGDLSYKFSKFTVGAGGRYFHEDQAYTNGPSGAVGPFQTGSFHAFSPRGYAQFQLSDQINVYGSVAKGFRSGGFNGTDQPTYAPENLVTYELGTKSRLADGHLSTDVAVFYSDYKNYQVYGSLPVTGVQQFSNAGSAWIEGLEWQITARLSEAWTTGLNGDYLKTRLYRLNVTDSQFFVGDPLNFVPDYQFTVFGQRDFTLHGKPADIRLDYNQQGREVFRDRSQGPAYFGESDVIHMLNLDANWQWSDILSFGLFAKNLLNDRGYLNGDTIENGAPRARPLTFGVRFNLKLN